MMIRILTFLRLLSFVPLLVLFSTTVSAHSFSVLLASPFSGQNARQGISMKQGFLIASAERDAHPDETADGHLGGLDVHLHSFDTAQSTTSITKALAHIEQDIDIVIIPAETHQTENLILYAKSIDAVVITPADLPFEGLPRDSISANQFVNNYTQRFAVEPGRSAAQGYQLARRIDEAVRPFNSAENTTELNWLLNKTLSEFKW